MDDNIKKLDLKEFKDGGYLQELNRRFLHPLGLAMAVKVGEDGEVTFDSIWDCRDDVEGIVYDAMKQKASTLQMMRDRRDKISNEIQDKVKARNLLFGLPEYIEPLDIR